MNAINIGIGAGDIAAVTADLARANAADSWNITAIAGKVTLSPANLTVSASSTASFTAQAPSVQGLGLNLVYHWNVAGSLGGTLSDSNHNNQVDFDSTSGTVTYTAPASVTQGNTDVLTATVYVITSQATGPVQRQLVGTTTANITGQSDIWTGTWVGSIASTAGAYSGPLTYIISNQGNNNLSVSYLASAGNGGYGAVFNGNVATNAGLGITLTVTGSSMQVTEVATGQTGTLIKQ